MDIKQGDLIKFWTWCGFKLAIKGYHYQGGIKVLDWLKPDGSVSRGTWVSDKGHLPALTLDNIYRFAIPKLQKEGYNVELIALEHKGFRAVASSVIQIKTSGIVNADSPTEALYNAIMKVIENEQHK